MKPTVAPQELIRRFNEDDAVWRRYEHKRALRRFLVAQFPLAEKILDDLDWIQAERECRKTRCIGTPIP